MRFLILLLIVTFFSVPNTSQAQSIDYDKQLGAENAKMVEAQMGIYEDKKKTTYIRKVGGRLVANLENPLFEYQFHIIPEPSPNAFALPGGYVYVTTGLIPLLETEDELACILAHEIIHANNRHSIKQMKKSIFPKLLEVPGNLVGVVNKNLGAAINSPIQTSNALLFASYGRKYETEADKLGTQLAAAAGYDPNALINALNRISEGIEIATGNKEKKSYFNDHPYTPNRVKKIVSSIEELEPTPKDPISSNFIYEFDNLLFGASPANGVIRENQFLHPDINFSIQFPKDWTLENSSSTVGAYHPERKAAVFASLGNPGLKPEEAGKEFLEKLEPQLKEKLTLSQPYKVNDQTGYLVAFEESNKTDTMYAYVLWFPLGKNLFKLVGLAPIEYRPHLEKTAESLRPLTAEEKKSFTIDMVRIKKAKEGETLKSISERSENILKEELLAIINDRQQTEKLKEGDNIKVVIKYPYKVD